MDLHNTPVVRTGKGAGFLAPAALAVALLFHAVSAAASGGQTVSLDHESGYANPGGVIVLEEGEYLEIRIVNTQTACFTYNFKAVDVEIDSAEADALERLPRDSFVFPRFVHDGKNRDYHVFIAKKAGLDKEVQEVCDKDYVDLPERGESNPWVVNVRTYGWRLAFAGGATIDGLVDPVYALQPGEQTVGDQTQTGFNVIQQTDAEDEFEMGAAAMVHLYHSDPEKPKLRRWAPVSFGLAINNGSDVRYFLGTSMRFGTQLFLTGGVAFGSVSRLPNGLDLGDNNFTTDSNALQNLGSRTDAELFIGLSYSFLGSKQPFQDALTTTPSAAGGSSQSGSGQLPDDDEPETPEETEGDLEITADEESYQAAAGESTEATVTVKNPGTASVDIDDVGLTQEGEAWAVVDDGAACKGASLGKDESCELKVQFTAPAEGCDPVQVTVTVYSGGNAIGSIALEGACGSE